MHALRRAKPILLLLLTLALCFAATQPLDSCTDNRAQQERGACFARMPREPAIHLLLARRSFRPCAIHQRTLSAGTMRMRGERATPSTESQATHRMSCYLRAINHPRLAPPGIPSSCA